MRSMTDLEHAADMFLDFFLRSNNIAPVVNHDLQRKKKGDPKSPSLQELQVRRNMSINGIDQVTYTRRPV